MVGATQETCALRLPPDADEEVGASGTVAGVAVALTVEDSESPTEFVAITRKVYAVPFVKPSTVTGEDELVLVIAPGSAITV